MGLSDRAGRGAALRLRELRAKLAADIVDLTARAEAADAEAQPDPQALPAEIVRRDALKAKLDAACARLEEHPINRIGDLAPWRLRPDAA